MQRLLLCMLSFLGVQQGAVAQTPTAGWTSRASMSTKRSDFTPVTVGAFCYVGGGCVSPQKVTGAACSAITNLFEKYDFAADKWTALTPMPRQRYRYAVASFNNNIYYITGRDLADNVVEEIDVYSIAGNSWKVITTTAGLLSFSDAAAFTIGSIIYVTGGWVSDYLACRASTLTLNLTTTAQLDAPTIATDAVPPRHYALGDIGAVAIGTRAYVFGGWNATDGCNPSSVLEMYDSVANTWTVLPNAFYARGDMGIAAIGDVLFVAGGETKEQPCNSSSISQPIMDVEVFDTTQNKWSVVSPIAFPRFRFGTAVYGNNIYDMGGMGTANGTGNDRVFPELDNVFSRDISASIVTLPPTGTPSPGPTEAPTPSTGAAMMNAVPTTAATAVTIVAIAFALMI